MVREDQPAERRMSRIQVRVTFAPTVPRRPPYSALSSRGGSSFYGVRKLILQMDGPGYPTHAYRVRHLLAGPPIIERLDQIRL